MLDAGRRVGGSGKGGYLWHKSRTAPTFGDKLQNRNQKSENRSQKSEVRRQGVFWLE